VALPAATPKPMRLSVEIRILLKLP
jgi:hypothetical protein